MKGTKEFYDKTSQDWAARGYAEDGELTCLREYLNMLPEHGRVLDLCCGAGYETMRIRQHGYEAVGVDFSRNSLAIAREHNPEIHFYEENLLNDYSYIGQVDGIILVAGLVHIENEQLPLAFQRMAEVVKKNGPILLTVREGHGKMEDRSRTTIDGEEYDRNFIAHTLEELKQASAEWFDYQTELESDMMVWKNYVFIKKV